MQSSSIIISSPFHPFSTSKLSSNGRNKTSLFPTATMASRRSGEGDYGGSRMVDENMIVLRKRIHEMKMIERNYEAPSDWMEWEKHYYTSYDSTVCEAMGVLQTLLMNTRPSLALGIIALVALSASVSAAVLLSYSVELGKLVLKGIHLN